MPKAMVSANNWYAMLWFRVILSGERYLHKNFGFIVIARSMPLELTRRFHLLLVLKIKVQFYSVQFSRSVVSDSLRPHDSQHARPPCPSPTPGVHSNSCASSQWCHSAVSSSVIPFSSCPQSLPASGSFLVSHLFAWGGQSIGVSASASVLPVNTQDNITHFKSKI